MVVDIPVFTGNRSHNAMRAFAADWNEQHPTAGTRTDSARRQAWIDLDPGTNQSDERVVHAR